ncbi:hypothetical protein AXA44_12345 [Rhodococcus sp. SC4]|nr:hypothetical protein AXA44_12345 [Rhodococcus sp. SC4]
MAGYRLTCIDENFQPQPEQHPLIWTQICQEGSRRRTSRTVVVDVRLWWPRMNLMVGWRACRVVDALSKSDIRGLATAKTVVRLEWIAGLSSSVIPTHS